MTAALEIRKTDCGEGEVFETFFAGYQQSFTLPDEMEDREGFAACLALNHEPKHGQLVARFGPFRELCLSLHEADGSVAAGANLIAFAHGGGPITVNLNYAYVLPQARGRGHLRCVVDAVARAARQVFPDVSEDVLVFIEQNDPLRMSLDDQRRDAAHSGMDQFERLAIWGRLGARTVDFPYVQPPLSPAHPANDELVLSVIHAAEATLPAALLHHHLRGFFGISVAKGGPMPAAAHSQLELLTAMAQRREPVRLIDPMPALALTRPAIGDWPDFRSFAKAAAAQRPFPRSGRR